MGQLNRFKHSTSGQRAFGLALAFMLPVDVLSLVDPAAGAADSLLAATATVAAPVTVLKAGLVAGGLTMLAAAPGGRKINFTTAGSTPSDAPATATIVGIDGNGDAKTEVLALAQTATVVSSITCWRDITSITYAAADGTNATVAIGVTNVFGLVTKALLRGGGVPRIYEMQDATMVTNGVLTSPAASAPNGGYAPNSTPNGALDFHLCYEVDGAALGL